MHRRIRTVVVQTKTKMTGSLRLQVCGEKRLLGHCLHENIMTWLELLQIWLLYIYKLTFTFSVDELTPIKRRKLLYKLEEFNAAILCSLRLFSLQVGKPISMRAVQV